MNNNKKKISEQPSIRKSKTTVGVIGCGYWGPNLVRNFATLDSCEVKAVCDTDPARLKHISKINPGVTGVTDAGQVIDEKNIDAVVIATPVRFHYELAKRALQAGKHVFVEKPMATSAKDCAELNAIASEHGLVVMVGHTFIYSPVVRRLKELVVSGDLGEIQYITSRRLNLGLFQMDINVVWDLAPHDVSIILYLLDEFPMTVNCQGKAHVTKNIEDVAATTLGFKNGRLALIHSSWLDPNKVREMTIVGSKRMVVYDDLQPLEKIKIYDKRVDRPPHYDSFADFHYSYHYGDVYSPYVKQVEPLRSECEHFIDCIRTGRKPESSGVEGQQVVQILEAASESLARNGNVVRVSAPTASWDWRDKTMEEVSVAVC